MTEEDLKKEITKRCVTLAKDLAERSVELTLLEWPDIYRDYNTALETLVESEVPTKDHDRTYNQDEYISTILDGHMDTLCKTVLNLIVSSITEQVLVEKGVDVQIPSIVDYIRDNKEYFNLDNPDKSVVE